MNIRRYRPQDQRAVIRLFREFMWELAPPALAADFQAYIERAVDEELGRIEEYYFRRDDQARRKGIARTLLATAEAFCRECGYRRLVLSTSELQVAARRLYEASGYHLVREEKDAAPSHKSAGAGLTRFHYEKMLA